jgi:hypothetical protein
MCRVISPRAAYQLSDDWIDKDPRIGVFGFGTGAEYSGI